MQPHSSLLPEHMAFTELARPENPGTRRALGRIVRQVGTILGTNPPPQERYAGSALSFFRATNAAFDGVKSTSASSSWTSEARMLMSEFMEVCDWLEGTGAHRPLLVFWREWLDWHVQEARYEACGSATELWQMMQENEKKTTWKTLSAYDRLLRRIEQEMWRTRADELKQVLAEMEEKIWTRGIGIENGGIVFGNKMLYRARMLAERLEESKAADDSWAA